jgi:hypothetical protein
LKRIAVRILSGLLAAAAIVWTIDWAAIAIPLPPNRQIYADIRVDQVYTDLNKWNEIEYSRGDPVSERCVYALFPHNGSRPCWYVTRHTMQTNKTY